MSCEMCNVRGLSVMGGFLRLDEAGESEAYIACCPGEDGSTELRVEVFHGPAILSVEVPIRHCPWCGSRLEGAGE